MPYLDGPGLDRALERRLPDLCRRFVLMTGDVLSAEIQTFLELTGVPGLSKPFDRSEVRRVIQLVAGEEGGGAVGTALGTTACSLSHRSGAGSARASR